MAEASFEEIFKLYRGKAYSLAYGILQNREDAVEVTQAAFIRLFRSLPTFRGEAKVSTWLYRVVVNLCIDIQRRETARAKLEVLPPAPPADPFQATARRELAERVREGLKGLPPEQRTAIILREVEGLTYREIAKVMRCSVGTVMSRLHYARRRLREVLGEGEV